MDLLNIEEVASFMRCSSSTIRRRIAEARKGNSTFPLPIHGDRKRGLWRKDDIEIWSEVPSSNTCHIESPSVRNRHIEVTRNQLRELGIKISDHK